MKKFVDGIIVEMTAEEIAARQAEEQEWNDGAAARNLSSLREERNRKLAETDWTRMDDNGLSDSVKASWATYRQELRDITDNATSLDDVTWPTKP